MSDKQQQDVIMNHVFNHPKVKTIMNEETERIIREESTVKNTELYKKIKDVTMRRISEDEELLEELVDSITAPAKNS